MKKSKTYAYMIDFAYVVIVKLIKCLFAAQTVRIV